MLHRHLVHVPPLASSAGWRSSPLSSSWSAWTYGTGSSRSHPPAGQSLIWEITIRRNDSFPFPQTAISSHLLDGDADSDWVDGALDQNLLLVVAADDHGLEQQLFTAPEVGKGKSHTGCFSLEMLLYSLLYTSDLLRFVDVLLKLTVI